MSSVSIGGTQQVEESLAHGLSPVAISMSAAGLGSGPLSDVEEGSSGRQVSSRIRGTWRGLGSGSSRNRSTASILSSYRLHLPLRPAWSRSRQAACQSSSRTDPVFVQAVSIAVRAWARARSSCAHSMTSSSISRAPAASRHGMPWNAVFGSGRPSRIALPIPTRDGRGGTPDAVVSVSPSYVRAPRKRCKSLIGRWWNRCAGQFFRCRGHRCGGWRRCSAVTGRVHPNSRTCSPHDLRRCGPDRGSPVG